MNIQLPFLHVLMYLNYSLHLVLFRWLSFFCDMETTTKPAINNDGFL